jgi:hypothetical protein
MLKTLPVALDGIHTILFQKGQEIQVEPNIAKLLVRDLNAASFVLERTTPVSSEQAVIESAPNIKKEEPEVIAQDAIAPIRIFQLAKELGISNSIIIKKAKKLGIDASAPASNLSAAEVERIKKALDSGD